MEDPGEVTVGMDLTEGYQFLVDFHLDGVPAMTMDEPEPLGDGAGPNASRMLAAAVANCLSASALFCLRKAHIEVRGMRTSAAASLVRNERGRLRVGAIKVRIQPEVDPADAGRIGRCLELFEDFCVVSQSVRAGVELSVDVEPMLTAAPPPQRPT